MYYVIYVYLNLDYFFHYFSFLFFFEQILCIIFENQKKKKMLSNSASNLTHLTTKLNQVNNDLYYTIESELEKLKEQEKQLQTALKLKTRNELLRSMEKELVMDNGGVFLQDLTNNNTALMLTNSMNLNQSAENEEQALSSSTRSYPSLLNNTIQNNNFVSSAISHYQTLNLNNLSKSIDVSDDGLRKSNQILDKLIRDYSMNSIENCDAAYLKSLQGDLNELIKSAAYSSSFKNKYPVDQQNLIKPNVVIFFLLKIKVG
jgi:hypothetical protein